MGTKKEAEKEKETTKKPKEAKEIAPREKKAKEPIAEVKAPEKYFAGVGRRKTAVATVRIFEKAGGGDERGVLVNGKTFKEYFPTNRLQNLFLDPIRKIGLENMFAISVHVRGGGPSGQAAASGLGLARALIVANPEHRPLLKAGKFLTRDARKVERKKPGLNKARRAPQWSKR